LSLDLEAIQITISDSWGRGSESVTRHFHFLNSNFRDFGSNNSHLHLREEMIWNKLLWMKNLSNHTSWGGQKCAKKCHLLFEWPGPNKSFLIIYIKRKYILTCHIACQPKKLLFIAYDYLKRTLITIIIYGWGLLDKYAIG